MLLGLINLKEVATSPRNNGKTREIMNSALSGHDFAID